MILYTCHPTLNSMNEGNGEPIKSHLTQADD